MIIEDGRGRRCCLYIDGERVKATLLLGRFVVNSQSLKMVLAASLTRTAVFMVFFLSSTYPLPRVSVSSFKIPCFRINPSFCFYFLPPSVFIFLAHI